MACLLHYTCAVLFCTLGFFAESSQVATSYEPRSQTLDGWKQQGLEKEIDGQINKFKAMVSAHPKPIRFHAHPQRKNKTATNPHVRHLQEVLNGTAMENITPSSNLYHMDKTEEKVMARGHRFLFGKKEAKEQVEHPVHVEHVVNASAPVLQAAPTKPSKALSSTKTSKALSSHIHELATDVNATAKVLNVNLSRPAIAVKKPPEHKSPTHADIQKANMKAFGESPSAWQREHQVESMQKIDRKVQEQVNQTQNHSTRSQYLSTSASRQPHLSSRIHELVSDVKTTAKELNVNLSAPAIEEISKAIDARMSLEHKNLPHSKIQKTNKKTFRESPNALQDQIDREVQKQMSQSKNHSLPPHGTKPGTQQPKLSSNIHVLVADVNATAKELNVNLSSPALDVKMHTN